MERSFWGKTLPLHRRKYVGFMATKEKSKKVRARIGDYVLATKYSDRDPHDPWRVGFICEIIEDQFGISFVIGEQDLTYEDKRRYGHVKKLTKKEGKDWIDNHFKNSP